jgi:hypothetical protein
VPLSKAFGIQDLYPNVIFKVGFNTGRRLPSIRLDPNSLQHKSMGRGIIFISFKVDFFNSEFAEIKILGVAEVVKQNERPVG